MNRSFFILVPFLVLLVSCNKNNQTYEWTSMFDKICWNNVFLGKKYKIESTHWHNFNGVTEVSGDDLYRIFNKQPYEVRKNLSPLEYEKYWGAPIVSIAPCGAITFSNANEYYTLHWYKTFGEYPQVHLTNKDIVIVFLYTDAQNIIKELSELLSARINQLQ